MFMMHFMQSPHVSSVIGGIGLGSLVSHLPRFRQEKFQTLGIGALTAGYLIDSASHILLASSSVGALGLATVGLLAGGTALATYAGIEWASRKKDRSKSKYATAAVAGIGALHFASHAYMAARALLGSIYASVSLFGAGLLGLVGNLGLVLIATYTLLSEFATHGHVRSESKRPTPASGKKRAARSKIIRRGTANLLGRVRKNKKVFHTHAKVA